MLTSKNLYKLLLVRKDFFPVCFSKRKIGFIFDKWILCNHPLFIDGLSQFFVTSSFVCNESAMLKKWSLTPLTSSWTKNFKMQFSQFYSKIVNQYNSLICWFFFQTFEHTLMQTEQNCSQKRKSFEGEFSEVCKTATKR